VGCRGCACCCGGGDGGSEVGGWVGGKGGRGGKCRAGVSFFLYLGLVRGREGMLVAYITAYDRFVECYYCSDT